MVPQMLKDFELKPSGITIVSDDTDEFLLPIHVLFPREASHVPVTMESGQSKADQSFM